MSSSTEPITFSVNILPLSVIFLVGGVVSTFFNALIVLAIATQQNLRTNCNLFVQQLAISNIVSTLSFAEWGLLGILGQQRPDMFLRFTNRFCVLVAGPGILSLGAGSLLILLIGIDRLIALRVPLQYQHFSRHFYYIGAIISWLSGAGFVYIAFEYSTDEVRVPTCYPPTAFRGKSLVIWNAANIFLNCFVIVVYLTAMIVARRSLQQSFVASGHHKYNQLRQRHARRNWRVFCSLAIVALVYLLTWVATMLVIRTLLALDVSPSTLFHGVAYVGILALLNVSCDFFVYFSRNKDLRAAFVTMLKLSATSLSESASRRRSSPPDAALATTMASRDLSGAGIIVT